MTEVSLHFNLNLIKTQHFINDLFVFYSYFNFFMFCFIGESSILDVPIQAGDQDFEYLVTVRVRIFDIYGDYGTYSKELVVDKSILYLLTFIINIT